MMRYLAVMRLFFLLKVSNIISMILVLISTYLVVGPIISNPQIDQLYAFLFIVDDFNFNIYLIMFNVDRDCTSRYQMTLVARTFSLGSPTSASIVYEKSLQCFLCRTIMVH